MEFWRRYLVWIGVSLAAMGLWIVAFKNTPVFAIFVSTVERVFWPNNIIPEVVRGFRGFMYSFSGTFLLLWGLNFACIAKFALVPGNKWAWNCLALSTMIWFTIMMPSSVLYKVYYNAIADVLFLIIIAIPMLKIRKFILSGKNYSQFMENQK